MKKIWMIIGLFCCCFVLPVSLPAQEAEIEPTEQADETSIRWQTDLDDALEAAAESGKPVLLYFSAGWCQPCELLKSTTLRDPAVISLVSPYLKVQIDYDSEPQLAARYGIAGIPAILLLDANGQRVATSVGYRDSGQFQEWLARHAADVAPEAALLAEQSRNDLIQTISDQLTSGDPAAHVAALTKMFDECVQKNIVAMTYARATLAEIAADKPDLLEQFLNDPRLLVRILVGNAMTSVDPEFPFDPWQAPPP